MTYVDTQSFPRMALIPGRAHDPINRFFGWLGQVGGAAKIEENDFSTASQLTPLEVRLRSVQDMISKVSMHLPKGFTTGLNRQFANLMDKDGWEDGDELLGRKAVSTFIFTLLGTRTMRRPGIGTNGRGSITCSWTNGDNRLTIECLPSERVSLILSRRSDDGELERAAFEAVRPDRVRTVLAPFNPEVWFDG